MLMMGLLAAFGVFLAGGLFFVTADLLRITYLGTSKAMVNTGREKKTAAKTLETYLLTVAARFAPYVRMDAYKRSRLKNILKASGLNLEPEVYQAYALVKAGAVMLGILPALLVFPLLSVMVVFLSVMVYFKESYSSFWMWLIVGQMALFCVSVFMVDLLLKNTFSDDNSEKRSD